VAFAATVFLGACPAAGDSDPIAMAIAKAPIEVENR
jgi:hypothetical protein